MIPYLFLTLYHSNTKTRRSCLLCFPHKWLPSHVLTVSLSSAEGAISLSIVWLEGSVLCCAFSPLCFSCCWLSVLKIGSGTAETSCIAQMLLSHHLGRGLHWQSHVVHHVMSCNWVDILIQNVFPSLCIFNLLVHVVITPEILAVLMQSSTLNWAMQTRASLCAFMAAESCWDTQWLTVWHREAPALSSKGWTCVWSHTPSLWADVTNHMYTITWHSITVYVQLVMFPSYLAWKSGDGNRVLFIFYSPPYPVEKKLYGNKMFRDSALLWHYIA